MILPRPLTVLLAALLLVLALFPLYGPQIFPDKHVFIMQKLTGIMIVAMVAMSLDLLVGIAGMVSLGHAAFFGLGGYMLALLSPEYQAADLWLTLPATIIAAAAAAALVGLLAIRTSGVYFIMVTLAFGQMGYYFFNDSNLIGGSDGAFIYVKPAVALGGSALVNLEDKTSFFYVVLGLFVGTFLLLSMLLASPFGRVLAAIGVNEGRVRGLGFNPVAYKLAAFAVAGAIAGMAGYFAAAQYGFVNPAMLSWHESGRLLVIVILGGMGTLFGPVIGAFIFELARMGFEALTVHWLLLMGVFVILVVLLLPRGIGGLMMGLCARPKKEADER